MKTLLAVACLVATVGLGGCGKEEVRPALPPTKAGGVTATVGPRFKRPHVGMQFNNPPPGYKYGAPK